MSEQERRPASSDGLSTPPPVRPGLLMALAGPFSAFTRHRDLTRELVRSEVLGRYRGASFGLMWSLISPFLMLMVYTIAFGEILKGRWPQAPESNAEFSIILFLGIIVHSFFAECFTRAPRLMLENSNYVKRVVFPLEILPWAMAMSALFHTAMNIAVFLLLSLLVYQDLSVYAVLLPLVFIPLILMTIAISWLVASLGVYMRDISQVTPVLATAMFFLSSAIIPMEAVPEKFRLVFHLNPLTFFINQARDVALWGKPPDWTALAIWTAGSLLAAYIAYAWFRKTSKGFADVI